MKKLFLIGVLMCISAGIFASIKYRTTCGICFTSTGPAGYPGGEAGYNEFLMEMNEYFCHESGMPEKFEFDPGHGPL